MMCITLERKIDVLSNVDQALPVAGKKLNFYRHIRFSTKSLSILHIHAVHSECSLVGSSYPLLLREIIVMRVAESFNIYRYVWRKRICYIINIMSHILTVRVSF